jgi:hypothetical protein
MVRRIAPRLRIDLVDLAIAVLPDPEAALGPGQAGVAAFAGRGDRCQDVAGGRIDLVDAGLGDLVEVGAVERGAGVAGALERAGDLAAGGVESEQFRAGRGPHAAAVVRDAMDGRGAGEWAVLPHDLGGTRRRARNRRGCPVLG